MGYNTGHITRESFVEGNKVIIDGEIWTVNTFFRLNMETYKLEETPYFYFCQSYPMRDGFGEAETYHRYVRRVDAGYYVIGSVDEWLDILAAGAYTIDQFPI